MMSEYSKKKYGKVVVFSGGGTRFALYCGMYAALDDIGHAPDLIVAACGGAVAAGIINSFGTNAGRKQYLESEELYEFIRSTKLTSERKLSGIGMLCLKKILNKRNAPYIEDVFNRYLVDMPEDISVRLPSLASVSGRNVKSVMIGARALFDKSEIGRKRLPGRKLYRKVIFTDNDTAQLIDLQGGCIQPAAYRSSAVDSSIEMITDMPMHAAMRISLSDMFYVSPVTYGEDCFTGGAIDLMPVELAKSLGEHVILEKKRGYSVVEEALVRSVLGYSGNVRRRDVETQGASLWIDTQNAAGALEGYYCKKSIDWSRLQVSVSLPESHSRHVKNMDMQWNYGYECVMKAFEQ